MPKELVYRLAGIIGCSPAPYTLRQLMWMVSGKGEFEWSMTANFMALEINMNRKKGARAINPSELNPYTEKKNLAVIKLSKKESMDALKKVFVRS